MAQITLKFLNGKTRNYTDVRDLCKFVTKKWANQFVMFRTTYETVGRRENLIKEGTSIIWFHDPEYMRDLYINKSIRKATYEVMPQI